MSKRLTEATLKLVQEMHRPGRVFYNPDNDSYFSFKFSITVDKKEANQLTCCGGGSYMTEFFDGYTDVNQQTKGCQAWRQCKECLAKGKICYLIGIVISYFMLFITVIDFDIT